MKHDALGAMLLVMAVALTLTLIAIPGVDDKPMSPATRVAQAPAPQPEAPPAGAAGPVSGPPAATTVVEGTTPSTKPTPNTATENVLATTAPIKAPAMEAPEPVAKQPAPAKPEPSPAAVVTHPSDQPVPAASTEPPAAKQTQAAVDDGAAMADRAVESEPAPTSSDEPAVGEADSSKPVAVATAEPIVAPPTGVAALYAEHCAGCHDGNQAPRLGDQQEWVNRFARGMEALKLYVMEDDAHRPVAGELSADQISETLTHMMAETFWPQSH